MGKTMFGKTQDQKVAENGVAVQVGESADGVNVTQTNNTQNVGTQTNHYGVTVEQVRAIATDAFKADFYQLLGMAGDVATARAQKLCDDYLARIEKENAAALNQANNPDFRYALLTAQKAYARDGDQDLQKLLVELLVQRSRQQARNLEQIVLNEALEVASRITQEQLSALTICFVMRRVASATIHDFNEFLNFIDEHIQPYIANAKLSATSYSHLEYAGCGAIEMAEVSLADAFLQKYNGLWQKGFPPDDEVIASLNAQAFQLIRPSAHVPGWCEVVDASTEITKLLRDRLAPDGEQREKIESLLSRPRLTHNEIKERCIHSRPYMETLFDFWDNTNAKHFIPSSVGIAIAHANIQRTTKLGPLSIWVN
jgi:hypothetical protein